MPHKQRQNGFRQFIWMTGVGIQKAKNFSRLFNVLARKMAMFVKRAKRVNYQHQKLEPRRSHAL
jgi:hypothetical protein